MSTTSDMKERFLAMASRVEAMGQGLSLSDPSSLLRTQTLLEQIIKDLQDMVRIGQSSGATDTKIMQDVIELYGQTTRLHKHLSDSISKQQEAARSLQQQETDLIGKQPPLNRDEIGKLLLLTSRGYKRNELSFKQRAYIKHQILLQQGYLRVIIPLNDINKIMSALRAVGGDE